LTGIPKEPLPKYIPHRLVRAAPFGEIEIVLADLWVG